MNTVKWSFSSLKDYINCPRQYQEIKVLKRFHKAPTQQTLYGQEVHRALEDYVKDGTPLAKNYQKYKPQLDPLRDMPGDKYPEHRMALTIDKEPCKFGSPDYWVRGIADLVVVDGDTGFIVDYKTGKSTYPDLKQLQLMALMAFAHFPQLERIKGGLLFVAYEDFFTSEYTRDKIDEYWESFNEPLTRLQFSLDNDTWQENPTGLCGWCPVSICQHYKER
jgi:CRISPR/Cas system-associated exonuclease Cas4 (RecB family)